MSTSTREYLAIIGATSKLATAVKNNITPLSLKLVEKFLITREQQEAVRNPNHNADERAADLVGYIQDKVKQDANNYHIFVGILEEDELTYKEILKELKPPSSCGQGAQHSTSTPPSTTSVPRRSASPQDHELDQVTHQGHTVRVISGCAAKWEDVALRLYFDGNAIKSIKKDSFYQTTDACKAMFNEWLNGREGLREPRTWATVVKILAEANLRTLSEELNSVLSD